MLGQAASCRALGAVAPCTATPSPRAPHRQTWRPSAGCTQRGPARQWQQQRRRQCGGGNGRSGAAAPAAARGRLVVCAATLKPGGSREKLPIFPLGMVALPAADVPLQIFEARYRVLFSTLMAGAKGIDEGLVNTEKPWCGSRQFGMAFYDQKSQGLAAIGTLLEITEHANLDDGRLLVNNIGRQRFRILDVVEEKPVLICEVEYLKDEEDPTADTDEARSLAAEVSQLFRSVVQLSVKLRETSVPSDIANPKQLQELSPCGLSFWVASLFAGNPYQQQALLEEESCVGRLKAEQELLSGTAKYLSAQAALQSAFKTTGGSSGSDPAPPAGGPD